MGENHYAVIMAGGVGSRFWPISVESKPKQFLDVLGIGKTLIQLTYERLSKVVSKENFYVVTNERYVDIVKEQIPELAPHQILSESERKNTAPSITYVSAKIFSNNPKATLIVAPSDHLILKEERFMRIVKRALIHADKTERILTLGIKPTRPDIGYGYIQFDQEDEIVPGKILRVRQFAEKPSREMAEIFLKSGDYYWNSGIFIWRAETILKAIHKFQPDLFELFCENFKVYNTPDEEAYINEAFRKCESISIDFAVMENAKNVDVILADFDWSDIGTWGSLFHHLDKDLNGNSIKGTNVHVFNSNDCLIDLPDDKFAIIQGLNQKIIVESENGLLILDMNGEQNLKNYLNAIERSNDS